MFWRWIQKSCIRRSVVGEYEAFECNKDMAKFYWASVSSQILKMEAKKFFDEKMKKVLDDMHRAKVKEVIRRKASKRDTKSFLSRLRYILIAYNDMASVFVFPVVELWQKNMIYIVHYFCAEI